MKSNVELSPKEFEVSFQIKMAMKMLNADNTLSAKENLTAAIRTLHESDL